MPHDKSQEAPLIDFSQPHCITMEAAHVYVPLYFAVMERHLAGGDIRQPVAGIDTSRVAPKAIEWKSGEYLSEDFAWTARDGVATINMRGPVVRYGGMLSALSGLASTGALVKSVKQAHEHKAVQSILFNFDSPGGDATSISEAATMIASLRGKGKPLIAYVDGRCCSAAYWLACACDEIVTSDTGESGSIGAVMILEDLSRNEYGVRQFIYRNSQSPKKFAQPGTKVGDDEYQSRTDALAAVFGQSVARLRGVSEAKVWKDFGQGGVLMGETAVRAGLCDRVGDYESLVTQLSEGYRPSKTRSMAVSAQESINMENTHILGAVMAATMNALGIGAPKAADGSETPPAPPTQAPPQLQAPPVVPPTVAPPTVPPANASDDAAARIAALETQLAAERAKNAPTREAQVAAFMNEAKPKVKASAHDGLQKLFEATLDGNASAAMLTEVFKSMDNAGTLAPVETPPAGATAVPVPADRKADDVVDESQIEAANNESSLARMAKNNVGAARTAKSGAFGE